MNNMEFNKIFAAFLVAALVAGLSGFVAAQLTGGGEHGGHGEEKFAYVIEAAEETGSAGGAAPVAEPILALLAAADAARGQQVAKACAACHTFDKGGANGTGPALWDVVNRAKASHGGFTYSDAMKAHASEKWTYAELNKFLWKPKAAVKGTAMNFVGIKKPEDRAALIAWLRTLADAPAALPSDADIAAEAPAPAEEAAPAATEAAPAEEPAAH